MAISKKFKASSKAKRKGSSNSTLKNALKKVLSKKKTARKSASKKSSKKKTVKKAAKRKVIKKAAKKKVVSKKSVKKKTVKKSIPRKSISNPDLPLPNLPKVRSNGIKLTAKLIRDIITEVSGEDCVDLYLALKGHANVSEFVLAETIDREINVTRNMLYRLYHSNLVSFVRKKDKQKGWYIYYWTFNPAQLSHLFTTLRKTRLEKLQERIDREQGSHFFTCDEKCMRLDFERATEYSYKCPECGEIMNMADNSQIVASLVEQLDKLEKTPARFK